MAVDYTSILVQQESLSDSSSTLIPISDEAFDYDTYASLLEDIETVMYDLFVNTEDALDSAEYALSLADSSMDQSRKSTDDLRSQVNALQTQASNIASQVLPITGGSYTNLITESFQTSNVRDEISAFDRQPLKLVEISSAGSTGCPPRPAMEVDPINQILRLKKEGESTSFTGLPGTAGSIGGRVEVDRIYGTPVDGGLDAPWTISTASRTALARGFNDVPTLPWLPDTYTAGGVARLHVSLSNPSPITEIRLRGALDNPTHLLETISAVNSSIAPTSDPAQKPTRNLSNNGTFSSGTLTSWSNIGGNQITFAAAPGRTLSNTDRAIIINGRVYQEMTNIVGDTNYILRYRAFCPYTENSSPASSWQYSLGGSGVPIPSPPESTLVQVHFYSSASPTFGVDSPLAVETFRDPYLQQGGLFAGVSSYVKVVKAPAGAQSAVLSFGTDPFIAQSGIDAQQNGVVAYSDIWLCDEAITRSWDIFLPSPSASNLNGPSVPNGVRPFVSEDSVDSITASLGNDTGALVITDVWVTLGQTSPDISPAGQWSIIEDEKSWSKPSQPYALSVPAEAPYGRSGRDPLILHQARYDGYGVAEFENPDKLIGSPPTYRLEPSTPLTSSIGLWSSILSRCGQRSAPVNQSPRSTKIGSYWKKLPGIKRQPIDIPGMISNASSTWPTLWQTILNLSKQQRKPLARMEYLLDIKSPQSQDWDVSSLYVYTMGLSSLSLIRREFAQSGLYVTKPVNSIDSGNAVPGELRELSILTDPPLSELGQRARFWVIPDSASQQGTQQDSPYALLARAIPLDSTTPRATFHSATETQPGLAPAISDIAESLSMPNPSFYIIPSLYTQTLTNGINPDMGGGQQLDYTPYVNKESIWNIISQITYGTGINPKSYDPNASFPIVEAIPPDTSGEDFGANISAGMSLLFTDSNGNRIPVKGDTTYIVSGTITGLDGSTIDGYNPGLTVSGDVNNNLTAYFTTPNFLGYYELNMTLEASGNFYERTFPFIVTDPNDPTPPNYKVIQGYVPIRVTLTLPNGQVIFPDTLGKPRPGEVVYQSEEILTPAQNLSVYNQPASTAAYAYTGAGTDPSAGQTQVISQQSFNTAYSPIVSGPNGAAIKLYWHQSQEFDPASGGILTRFDAPISSSQYTVNTNTGQVTVLSPPPYGYTAYDQVVAYYWWQVGDISPKEQFPYPGLNGLFLQNNGATPGPVDATSVPSGFAFSGELVNNPRMNGTAGFSNFGNSHFGSYAPGGVPSTNGAFTACQDGAGVETTSIPYIGPGLYNFGAWLGNNTKSSGAGGAQFESYIWVQILDQLGHVVESTPKFKVLVPAYQSPANPPFPIDPNIIAFCDHSGVQSLQLTATPPAWYSSTFPSTATPDSIQTAWNAYTATCGSGTQQIFFQWPNWASVTNPITGNGQVVSYDHTVPVVGDVDDSFVFSVIPGTTPRMPSLVQFPFQTPKTSGYTIQMVVTRIGGDGKHGEDNISVCEMDMTQAIPQFVQTCPPGYTYDPVRMLCVFSQSATTTTDINTGSATLAEILGNTPIQQSYPVTRNVTNYSSADAPTLNQSNMDPLSPDYYPVFEYWVKPGPILEFADDLSPAGQYAGTDINIQYQFLDINPRVALEILPDGQTCFSPPNTPVSTLDSSRPDVISPSFNSLNFLINAKQ